MRIKQGYVSKSLGFPWLNRYDLAQRHSPVEPCVFFGVYQSGTDARRILKHNGLAIVVWGGTDALSCPKETYALMRQKKNIKHIAISNFLVETLRKNGIQAYHFPLVATIPEPLPAPLGDCVYTYIDPRRPDFYGMPIINKIRERIDYPIIISYRKAKSKEWVYEQYKNSFIGLRLTRHDGLSNTVVEMGVYGRRCVWNGGTPNALKWETIDDIVRHIEREKNLGNPKKVADEMVRYIDIGDEWLTAQTYDKNPG